MRIFNLYIIIMMAVSCLTNVILAATGQDDLTLYVTLSIIVFLIVTLLHVYLAPKARRALGAVALVLFAGFMVIVIIKVINVLAY